MELYSQILDHGGPSFGAVLRQIKDRPSEGILFHCTAGKDRTGVIAAILLKVRSRKLYEGLINIFPATASRS